MNLSTTFIHSLWDSLKSALIVDSSLTVSVRSVLAGEPLSRFARRRCVVLLAALFVFSNTTNATAVSTPRDKENYKLYAHIKLLNAKQYRCLEVLWNKESRWDPRADNPKSSAYGIPQLLKMKELDPFKQIDLGLKYISARHSTPCKALEYHKLKGHY